jgi:hypothetical protein
MFRTVDTAGASAPVGESPPDAPIAEQDSTVADLVE